MFTPLLDSIKTAEPPPPEGVSVKEWDRILSKGPTMSKKTAAPIDLIRKLASQEQEERAFEELTSELPVSWEDSVTSLKLAAVEDQELLKIAADLCVTPHADGSESRDFGEVLSLYESLGGKYKHAFGQQMFDVKQMAGSPAVSGGMNARAKTPMPQMQQSPVSVTTTSIGQTPDSQGGASSTSQTSTPSAPTG